LAILASKSKDQGDGITKGRTCYRFLRRNASIAKRGTFVLSFPSLVYGTSSLPKEI
jgi:hypothetical protein